MAAGGTTGDERPDDHEVRVRVLGPLTLVVGGQHRPVTAPKQRTLLATLATAVGEPVTAARLVEELWPEKPPPTALSALQVHVSALRKVVGPALRSMPGGSYQLDLSRDSVDGGQFERLSVCGRRYLPGQPDVAVAQLATALTLWRGPAFDGVSAGPTIEAARTRLDQLRLETFGYWARAALATGDHSTVASTLPDVVGAHPADERLAGLLMLARYRCGQPAEVRAVYAGLRRALRRLGVEPGAEVSALAAAIERRDPTLAAPPAANLPTQTSRFIGRGRELEELADLLLDCRLLTLHGPGGVGKT